MSDRRNETDRTGRPSTALIFAGVAVIVIVAAVLALVFAGGEEDSAATTVPTTAPDLGPPDRITVGTGDDSRLPPELIGEAGDVEIEGSWLPRFDPEVDDPAIGTRPPTLFGTDAGGTGYTISPDIDGPVMLVFLAHWCPVCDDEVPHIAELERDGRLPDDLNVFGVLTGLDAGRPNFPASTWVVDRGWPFPAIADGITFDTDPPQWAASGSFGLSAYPYVVLVDDGVVVDRWSGGLGVDGLASRISSALS